jgi:hypothetical protein
VIGSALKAEAEILVTGDREMLELDEKPEGLQIVSPREFWNLAAGRKGAGLSWHSLVARGRSDGTKRRAATW